MKKLLLLILAALPVLNTLANHIVGGEVYYKYIAPGSTPGTSIYQVSLRLFRDCDVACGEGTNVACLPTEAIVTIYPNKSPYNPYHILSLPLTDSQRITLTTYPVCIGNKPDVCYEVKTYSGNVTLTDIDDDYVIAYQNCCRAEAKNQFGNSFTASGLPGATYTADIPGKQRLISEHNNSAVFKLKDTVLVCAQSRFEVDYSAFDIDGDSISYAFSPAFDGGLYFQDGCIVTPDIGLQCTNVFPGPPPYISISYNSISGFSGDKPLGEEVSINPLTGLIKGVAPALAGHYIVNVIANEWRKGKMIAEHRKDFIIHVEQCDIPQAILQPSYVTCDGYNLTFKNESSSSLITSYYWDFGDANTTADISLESNPTYTYSDSGSYVVTLITNKGQQCSDTATTLAKVYPGFKPGFNIKGSCDILPYQFSDLTTSQYGNVNYWH